MCVIYALWTHPRSISTAFERAMIELGDLKILHEPFYYYYYVKKDDATIEQQYVDPKHPMEYGEIKSHILATSNVIMTSSYRSMKACTATPSSLWSMRLR